MGVVVNVVNTARHGIDFRNIPKRKFGARSPYSPRAFSAPITITISTLALLLSIRKFFPNILSGVKSTESVKLWQIN